MDTPYPNIPAVLESDSREFRDTGVPSTVAIAMGFFSYANINYANINLCKSESKLNPTPKYRE